MYKAVIAGYSRSPFTMAKKGELIDIKPINLLAEVIKNLISKSKVNPDDIEDIVILIVTEQGLNQVFHKKKQDYIPKLKEAIEDFNGNNNT